MLPSNSNRPSLAWINASGWPSVGTSRYAKILRKILLSDRRTDDPDRHPDHTSWLAGKRALSVGQRGVVIAFLRTPGIERLYSGVTKSKPCAAEISDFNRLTWTAWLASSS